MSALSVLSAVPWGKIITYGPTIIETAGALLESVKKRFGKKRESASGTEPADLSVQALADRIAALEANEVRQAELVSNIAEQLGGLSDALRVVSQRVALALYLSLASVVVAVLALAIVVLTR